MKVAASGSAGTAGGGVRLVADLHIHSRFSRATSPRMDLAELAHASRRKGIGLLGTGDATHPEWLASLRRRLKPIADGVYEFAGVHFLVTGEISVVWREGGQGRRVHLLVLFPSIGAAASASRSLARMGAVDVDGRPTLRAGAADAAAAIWAAAPQAIVIPAHVWTPWYSVFGARSGFETLEACFGELAERIPAVETGLSSDPAMCRRVSALDRLTLASFSDAHSPDRVGRESTIFRVDEVSFPALATALSRAGQEVATIEVFPGMGKYYLDGHRACGVSMWPDEARKLHGVCPSCGKPLTVGVLHRVEELAGGARPAGVPPYLTLMPLDEIVGKALGYSPRSLRVRAWVEKLVKAFGSELSVLVDRPVEDLRERAPEAVALAVGAVRAGRVAVTPGYDGVYGDARLECLETPA